MRHLLGSRQDSRLTAIAIASAAAALLALGCGGSSSPDGGAPQPPTGTPPGPTLSELAPGWNRIEPGGETICSRGTPFSYFVRRGMENRVVIDFRGGGACWSQTTCSIAGSLFQETVGDDAFATNEDTASGIYDHKNPANPFKDWHHVYIPYCTGDIHWGDNVMTYGEGPSAITINHKGAENARAALAWTFANIPAPEKVFVTGCSAGAYGSIMWSAHVKKQYAEAKVYQLADSGAGIVTQAFFQQSYPSWKPEGSYPLWIEGLDASALTELSALYTAIGGHYKDMALAEYATQYDEDQVFYFQAMGGGDASAWSSQMKASFAKIEAAIPNFRAFIAPGDVHCIIPRNDFYSVESAGTRLVDWITAMVNDKPVSSVTCDGCAAP
jgi:hypothetical protein